MTYVDRPEDVDCPLLWGALQAGYQDPRASATLQLFYDSRPVQQCLASCSNNVEVEAGIQNSTLHCPIQSYHLTAPDLSPTYSHLEHGNSISLWTIAAGKVEIKGTINASGAGVFSLGDIYGTVANTINQLPSSSNTNEPGIKKLLTQLQQVVDDPNLSEEDQKQILEQIRTLAEAGQNPQDETMQKKAKKAVGFLKVIAEGIEPTTQLAQVCGKVLPKILLLFGS